MNVDVVIVGAGIIGVSAAYHLALGGAGSILLVDQSPPLSQTSAVSGENIRSWWPDPVLANLCRLSLDQLTELAHRTDNRFHLRWHGYAYASAERDLPTLMAAIQPALNEDPGELRLHDDSRGNYDPSFRSGERAGGVDLLLDPALIQSNFPHLDSRTCSILHVRRAGDLDAQQLGMTLLEEARRQGVELLRGRVTGARVRGGRVSGIDIDLPDGALKVSCGAVLLAAGPYTGEVAALFGLSLPLENTYQEKIAFEDVLGVIPRQAPFTIWTDPQRLAWSDEERKILGEDEESALFLGELPGGLHVRPEGGPESRWIKMGWAINSRTERPDPQRRPSPIFPELLLRGASSFIPAMGPYTERLPGTIRHYGGYYTATPDGRPLIGPLSLEGVHVATGFAGYGTMASLAAGEFAARSLSEARPDSDLIALAPSRFQNSALAQPLTFESGQL